MAGLFITATGTEIGKTLVTAALCHQAREADRPLQALKPIISGLDVDTMADSDTAVIAQALGLPINDTTFDQISPFRFKAPLAPTMAAKAEGRTLDYDAVIQVCRGALESDNFTLIEGVGGSFVPLADGRLVVDWITDLGLESILVAGSYLGTISHTISTLEAMQARGLKVRAIVVSESAPGTLYANPDLAETANEIERLTGLPVATIPRIQAAHPWRHVPPLLHLLDA
ncbi:dethiobiotin synthase [Kordiimonas lacus]|uniref:ATP-dependent dethiobiotin synthetase BioD n=1 Tax=Kordiimonas lacus TaxID=637679 RepID=A0A1G7E2L5_9PROT|nr:dethiobiotin synthase [Kordiimonas lacus]SDE57849.1 dethiobiotin synthetase [Kordiimonas lacus]